MIAGSVALPATGDIWRTWQQAHDAAPETQRWTRKLVADRLKEMMVTVGRSVGPVRPKGFGAGSPRDYTKDPVEIWFERMAAEHQLEQEQRERNRVVLTPSTEQIGRMEQAIHWQARYLALAPEPELRALQAQLACWQFRKSFAKECRELGLNRDTAKDRIERACLRIAVGLIADEVPTGEMVEDADGAPPPPPPAPPVVDLPVWWDELLVVLATEGLHPARAFIWHRVRDDYAGLPRSKAMKAAQDYEIRRLHLQAAQAFKGSQ